MMGLLLIATIQAFSFLQDEHIGAWRLFCTPHFLQRQPASLFVDRLIALRPNSKWVCPAFQ
jgi:hypothetical protein